VTDVYVDHLLIMFVADDDLELYAVVTIECNPLAHTTCGTKGKPQHTAAASEPQPQQAAAGTVIPGEGAAGVVEGGEGEGVIRAAASLLTDDSSSTTRCSSHRAELLSAGGTQRMPC